MKLLGKDDVLFEILKKEVSIISSSIIKIDIFTIDFELKVEIDIKLLYSEFKHLKLRFSKIKEYSFYYNNNYSFYTVECYKLIKSGDLFFISFDPEDETSLSISEIDQDSILCGSFEGYFSTSEPEISLQNLTLA